MVKENGMIMMTEKEYERILKEKERDIAECLKRIELMQSAIKDLLKEHGPHTDTRVSKLDFITIYNKALNEFFDIMENNTGDETPDEIDNKIYGHDFTVHWHGIYCNCGDGAAPSNYIIPAIEGICDEDPNEY